MLLWYIGSIVTGFLVGYFFGGVSVNGWRWLKCPLPRIDCQAYRERTK